MNNEEAKQKAIKAEWGDQYDDSVDSDGYKEVSFHDYQFKYNLSIVGDFDGKGYDPFERGTDLPKTAFVRPKSLRNISTNNGWTRVEPDGSNLPDEVGSYKVLVDSVYDISPSYFNPLNKRFFNSDDDVINHVTHYKPIKEEPKPLY